MKNSKEGPGLADGTVVMQCLKNGYFLHSDGKINNHWIDLPSLYRVLMNEEVWFREALRAALGSMYSTQERKADSVVVVSYPDRNLTLLPYLIQDVATSKGMGVGLIERITPDNYTMEVLKGKVDKNVMLFTSLSFHKDAIEAGIKVVTEKLLASVAGILVLVHWGSQAVTYSDSAGHEYFYSYLYRFFEVDKRVKVELNAAIKKDLL
jgi:hypothetical protein